MVEKGMVLWFTNKFCRVTNSKDELIAQVFPNSQQNIRDANCFVSIRTNPKKELFSRLR